MARHAGQGAPGLPVSAFPVLRLKATGTGCLTWVLRTRLQLCLHSTHFTHWAISSAPDCPLSLPTWNDSLAVSRSALITQETETQEMTGLATHGLTLRPGPWSLVIIQLFWVSPRIWLICIQLWEGLVPAQTDSQNGRLVCPPDPKPSSHRWHLVFLEEQQAGGCTVCAGPHVG